MMKLKKIGSLFLVGVFLLLSSSVCFAASGGQDSKENQTAVEKEDAASQADKYTAVVYDKNSNKTESEKFSTSKECFAWIKGKGLNGIVYSDISSKKAVGVELEGCEISFDSNYILKYDGGKPLYSKEAKAVQKALQRFGYKLKMDGYFGKNTCEAVNQFQKSVKLSVDGIVGVNTYESLVSSPETMKKAAQK